MCIIFDELGRVECSPQLSSTKSLKCNDCILERELAEQAEREMELQRAREQEEKKLKESQEEEEEIVQVVEETLECSVEEPVMAGVRLYSYFTL